MKVQLKFDGCSPKLSFEQGKGTFHEL